jgi:hypothetical protein
MFSSGMCHGASFLPSTLHPSFLEAGGFDNENVLFLLSVLYAQHFCSVQSVMEAV